MKKYLITLIFIASFPAASTHAQTVIGKYGGEFMATGFGSRALALGGASVGLAGDVTAAYWNPAGLMAMNYPEIGLMHEERFGQLVNFNYGGVAWPMGAKYTLAFSITRTGVDDIMNTKNALIDLNGNGQIDPNERLDLGKITLFNVAYWAGYLTYAFHGSENMNLGVNLKLIREDMLDGNAMGIGFDAGLQYKILPKFTLGIVVQDITTTLLAWNTGRKELITPTVKIGGAYSIEALDGTFTPVLDIDMMGENRQFASTMHAGPVSINPHGGVEYQFRNLFALRAGMDDMKNFTFGAGIHFPKLYLDYCFAHNDLQDPNSGVFNGATHRISLRVMLEETRFARIKTN